MNQNRWTKKQNNRNMSRSKEKVIQNIATARYGKVMKCFVGLFCLAMTFLLFAPMTANADMGPKPSVRILFENMKEITNIAYKSGCRRSEGRVLQRDIGIVVPVSRFAFMEPNESITI